MKIKNFFSSLHKTGFTLIELLIVIALLGTLAVALLAALDPLEQIKKGTDTGTRNTVTEIQGGLLRYYALKGSFPWSASTSIVWGAMTADAQSSALSSVIDSGELKNNFTSLAASQLSNIYVSGNASNVVVCYSPGSKSFRVDNNTKWILTGASPGTMVADVGGADGCPQSAGSNAGGAVCYWCVQ